MDINKNQKIAIEHNNGPMLVLAGPGSGKTFVLTRRIKYLIENKKINPENILVITFTRASANEMKDRFVKLCMEDGLKLNSLPSFGTFHSIFFDILKKEFGYSNDSLVKEEDENKIILEILEEEKNININENTISSIKSDIKNYKIGIEKGEKVLPKYLSQNTFKKFYEKYKIKMFDIKKLDFHDMIDVCSEMLKKHKDILKKYQDKFKYILIDEFQDINKEQYELVKLLSKNKNIFAVGDDDQSIYKFRGSRPKVMKDFLKDYISAKKVILNNNYRCANNIVRFSKNIINYNKERFSKDLVSNRENNGIINIKSFNDSKDENEYIVSKIREYIKHYNKYSDIAILFRTNLLSLSLLSDLSKYNIPFIIKDKQNSIFNNFVIKDIISYLKIISNNYTSSNFINVMNKPIRYISRNAVNYQNTSFSSIKYFYKSNDYVLKNVIKFENDIIYAKKIITPLAIKYIREKMGYDDYLIKISKEKGFNIDELLDILDELEEIAIKYNKIENFINYIENIDKIENNKTTDNENSVRLMTFHLSKGLEFNNVFIIDANEGLIPHKKSIQLQDIETERRLFYVAITRAKDNLDILFTKRRNGKNYAPSRFIKEGLKAN